MGAMTDANIEAVVSQIIDRARNGESFLEGEIEGLGDHKERVAERLKQVCRTLGFFADQMTGEQPPDEGDAA
jgi:hypothetical protein